RFVATVFWAALLVPAALALALDFGLNPIWTLPGLTFAPIVLLSSPRVVVHRREVAAVVAFAIGLPLVMLAASPAIAVALHVAGVDGPSAHSQLLAERIEQEWRRATSRPLRIVGGDFGIVNRVAFYLPEQPSPYTILEPEIAPWITPERIDRE